MIGAVYGVRCPGGPRSTRRSERLLSRSQRRQRYLPTSDAWQAARAPAPQ